VLPGLAYLTLCRSIQLLALLAAISRVLPRSHWSCFLVTPQTLLRWHRCLVADAWTYPRRGLGRPPLDEDIQQLIVRLAPENPRWGYPRIQGELLRLGIQISATAIRTTLRRQAAGILACDFFTVDTVWLRAEHTMVGPGEDMSAPAPECGRPS
jgi:putative transposase